MGILKTIVGAITGIAETVVTSIAAAIAAPTVGTVLTAVATVAVVAVGGYVIYKIVRKASDAADMYINEKCNPNSLPLGSVVSDHREATRRRETQAIVNDIAKDVCDDAPVEPVTRNYGISNRTDMPYDRFQPRRYEMFRLTDSRNDVDSLFHGETKKKSKKRKKFKKFKRMKDVANVKKFVDADYREVNDELFNHMPQFGGDGNYGNLPRLTTGLC